MYNDHQPAIVLLATGKNRGNGQNYTFWGYNSRKYQQILL